MVAGNGILLVEDNPDEAILTLRALRGHRIDMPVEVVHDGVEAMNHIIPSGSRSAANLPRFVILDLKLPRLDGFDVIRRLRADPRTRLLPLVVFSSSTEERDVGCCYEMGVNGYVAKPVGADRYHAAVGSILNYWLDQNQDPYRRI
jgi:two-component system response regulator